VTPCTKEWNYGVSLVVDLVHLLDGGWFEI